MLAMAHEIRRETSGGRRRYFAGDELIGPSVTTILDGVFGLPAKVDAETWRLAGLRGQAVHEAIHLLEGGVDDASLDWETLHPDIEPYLLGYDAFRSEHDWRPELLEQPVIHRSFHYGGTLDAIGLLDGVPMLADWKSGIALGRHAAQTAAYKAAVIESELVEHGDMLGRMTVYLKPNASYSIVKHTKQGDWYDFAAAMRVYDRKEKADGKY